MAERGKPFGSVVAGLGTGVGLAVAGWSAIGPDHPVFAVVAQAGFLLMALLVGPALVDVGRSRYRVRDTEPRLYALVGAEAVRRVLDSVGWNRIISRMRHSESGSSMVSRFLRGTEQSETAHLLGAVATALLAVLAAATGHAQGSAQILLTGLVLHGYPVMIQRMVRLKIVSRQTRTSPKPY